MFRKLRKKIAQRSNKKTGERSRTPQAKSGRFGPMAIEPLEQRLVLDSTVVFNEVMYHPGDAADGVVDGIESLEWIELYNQLAVDMDLSEWEIDGIRQMNPDGTLSNYMFPEGTVIPGRGYLVVAKDPGKLQAATGYTDALGGFLGSLANDGEELRLINNDERVLNVLNYNDAGDGPAGADGSGASLAKDNPQTATQPAENWTVSMEIGGTPGYENFPRVFEPIGGGTPLALDAPWQIDTSGTDLGTAWREPAYDDSGWTTFRADSPSVLITEVGTSTPDWAEIQCVAPEQIEHEDPARPG